MKRIIQPSVLTGLWLVSNSVMAGQLALPNMPLMVQKSAAPNVLFVVDDSGSMDWEIMAQPHFAACNYFNPNNYAQCSTTLRDTGLFYFSEPNSRYRRFVTRTFYYLFDKENKYTSTPAMAFSSLMETDWRVFDAKFNTTYYNPGIDYRPWSGPCSRDHSGKNLKYCDDAEFTRAAVHPKEGSRDYGDFVNLDNHTYRGRKYTHSYVVSLDNTSYTGSRPNLNDMVLEPNDQVDLWDSHARLHFKSSSSVFVQLYRTNPVTMKPELLQQTSLSGNACFDALGDNDYVEEILAGKRALSATDAKGCKTVSQARANFANWYEYNRRRAFAAKAGISSIMEIYPEFHYGLSYINDSNIDTRVPEKDDDISEHNLELLDGFFEDEQKRYSTPLVSALDIAGRYYQGKLSGEDPIKYECQLNNTIMLTDGYYNGTRPRRGDIDGDGYGNNGSTLADIARYYYLKDLAPNLANNVPTTNENPNSAQHMNTYGVAFGVKGKLVEGNNGWPTPTMKYHSNWGNPTNCDSCSEKIDDLWHAAFNSHARYSSVKNVDEMIDMLHATLGKIAQLSSASMSGVSMPSTVLQSDSYVYQSVFSTDDWTGDVMAYPMSQEGALDSKRPAFKTSEKLAQVNPKDRVIYSYNGAQGLSFAWPNRRSEIVLNEDQKKIFNAAAKKIEREVGKKVKAKDIVNYLRGDKSLEANKGGVLRNRETLLGDTVHSSPLYIGSPNQIYNQDSYLEFKESLKSRKPMLAVGANDGMLHILSAETGDELMAYIPGHLGLWSNLPALASPSYEHRYYVDGHLSSGDIYFETDKRWHTLLVGGMRTGGQGIFALDITEGFFSNNTRGAQKHVLFEFDDSDDPDMGYTFSKPQMVKMNNDQWAIILGNGYNASSNRYSSGLKDPHVSSSKKAYLFILFIEKGLDGKWDLNTDYVKIPVGKATRNGLSEPFPVDIDADYKVDYIYAGDLDGEIYKFDLTSSNPADWTKPAAVKTFFKGSEPITTPLVVGAHHEGLGKGMMVYFGTGQFIEVEDNSAIGQNTQSFYGLWDKNDANQSTIAASSSKLLVQRIIASNNQMRASTNYEIDEANHVGWKFVLEENGQNHGERSTSYPTLRNGRIIFTTYLPGANNESDYCQANAGSSWIMELDAKDGSRLGMPPYDMNRDNEFTEADYIYFVNPLTGKEESAPHSGIQSDVGMLGGTPAILTNPENDIEYKVLSGAGGISTKTESVDDRGQGRQSWQQVH